MRDWERERPVKKGVRQYGAKTVVGRISPYNELVDALGKAAAAIKDQDRKALHRLAWALGEAGEIHACQSIMEYAKEPAPYENWTYGVPLG